MSHLFLIVIKCYHFEPIITLNFRKKYLISAMTLKCSVLTQISNGHTPSSLTKGKRLFFVLDRVRERCNCQVFIAVYAPVRDIHHC